MEQLKTNHNHPNIAPTIRVKLQTGATNSVEFNSNGVEAIDACNTIEYLAQSSLKTTKELEELHQRNSMLFIICTTLILASISLSIGFTISRTLTTITQNSPRYEHGQN